MRRSLAILVLGFLCLCAGCGFGRYLVFDPERSRVIRVEGGDRYYLTLEERENGFRWTACSDDPDVEVLIDHEENEADVRIRIHRGFDGPSNVTFECRNPQTGEVRKSFVVSCFHSTGESAFWR